MQNINNEIRSNILKKIKRNRLMNRIMLAVPLTILAIIVLSAIFADIIAPYPPSENSLRDRLQPPVFMEEGSASHLLGTDHLGRDIFSRIVHGSRISLSVGIIVTIINSIIASVIGIISGYYGKRLDNFLMRIADVIMSFPALIIQLILAATLGPSFKTIIIAFTFTGWAALARGIRGLALSLRNSDFVLQAYINGCKPSRIMFRHMFPNIINYLVVVASMAVPGIIMGESILSYLGIGFPPPTPSWGAIVAGGQNYIPDAWWISVFPSIAIGLLVLSMFYIGDWLQDRLNPMLRQS